MRRRVAAVVALRVVAAGCGRRGPFAGGVEPYARWCTEKHPVRLRANCERPELAAPQAAWLARAEAGSPALAAYFARVYGGAVAVDAARVNFFWDSAPGRDAVAVQWSCYRCPRAGFLRPGRLWAPVEEAKANPRLLTGGLRDRCANARCAARDVWRDLEAHYDEARLTFPGFFVQRYDDRAPIFRDGVPDGASVEVLRVARVETKRLGTEVCTFGQVWFWRAAGSGIWLDVGASLRLNATDGAHAETCAAARRAGYDTIQLLRSFAGYSYEILDCRGALDAGADRTWTRACPPAHVPLAMGLPRNRVSAVSPVAAPRGGPCACDAASDHLNCANSSARPCDGAPP